MNWNWHRAWHSFVSNAWPQSAYPAARDFESNCLVLRNDLVCAPSIHFSIGIHWTTTVKVVVCFKNSGKFGTRYSTLEFQDAANLDDGDLWPVSFALREWSPAVEQKVAELVKAAVS